MIKTRFYTIVVRKDALAAKWPGGVEGYKTDFSFGTRESHQEDEHLITTGCSMGSDLDILLQSLSDPLTIYEKRQVTERPSWLTRMVGRVIGDRLAARIFGIPKSYEAVCFVDVAVASCGSPTRRCEWLKAHRDIGAVEFVSA